MFEWNGSSWVETAKLTASDGAAGDEFGWEVSLAGDRIVAGAKGDDTDQGAVYVFEWNGASWVEMYKVTAADGTADENFGYSVALNESRIAVGARYEDDPVDQGFGPGPGWPCYSQLKNPTQTIVLGDAPRLSWDETRADYMIAADYDVGYWHITRANFVMADGHTDSASIDDSVGPDTYYWYFSYPDGMTFRATW